MQSHRVPGASKLSITLLAALVFTSGLAAPSEQTVKEILQETDAARLQAEARNARMLAPNAYREGMELYVEATGRLEEGKNLDRVLRDLVEAKGYFSRANEAAALAEAIFSDALSARAAAERAEAPRYGERDWQRSEEAITAAAGRLEGGHVDEATAATAELEQRYRDAEAAAIVATARREDE